ncbi:LacI family DNA-binding transcriptional regulator [uncultured Microbacterium sp.]|uniref:LacI family DNA-binding transcriptional regulator n=1 Tax=uncultured Microbacterium sp. TaxID=191216 RepID=UPI0035CB4DE3
MSDSPTMNDVAREANVALKTVSRYVNGQTNINPVLAQRIADAIASLGYRRNLAAASIRPGWTSKTLGLIISDISNPYYSTLSKAIETYAADQGFFVISASSDEIGEKHDRFVERLMEQRVDGIIVVPPREPGRDWNTLPGPIPPVVFIDRPVDFPQADIILADNVGGARSATEELISNGAKKVAFVGDALSIYTMRERYRGYCEALAARGIPVDDGIVVSAAHSSEDAAAAVSQLLDADVDAIFAANNRASVGALLAFRETGRRLPMIGFDDFEAAKLGEPAVSVVSQDISEMGRKAAEIIFERIAHAETPRRTYVLPTTLVLRGSEIPDPVL